MKSARRIEQAIFRNIFEMACEMKAAEEKEMFLVNRVALAKMVEARPSKNNSLNLYYKQNQVRGGVEILSKVSGVENSYTVFLEYTLDQEKFSKSTSVYFNPRTRSKHRGELYEELVSEATRMVKMLPLVLQEKASKENYRRMKMYQAEYDTHLKRVEDGTFDKLEFSKDFVLSKEEEYYINVYLAKKLYQGI